MKTTYKEHVTTAKCSICGKILHNKTMWAVKVPVPGEEELRKWNFCERCCRSEEYARNIEGQMYVHFWCPPAEG